MRARRFLRAARKPRAGLAPAEDRPHQRVERVLRGFRPGPLFDLASDVERYPEFLRWWIAVRVLRRSAKVYHTEQILGLGPLRVRFNSKTILRRPNRIDVTSDQPPFRRFALSWIFEPVPGTGCRVTLLARMELRSSALQRIVDLVLPRAIADIAEAFEARARRQI
jgi:coenzyme Q-binding protein COQ10